MNNSSTVCVDASIVVRFVLSQDKAVNTLWKSWTRKETRLVAPSLLFYDLTNGLYRQQKGGLLSAEFIRSALEIALSFPVELMGDFTLHQRARELAARFNLSATYEAHYLALAERMGIELWTADARLFNTLQPFKIDWVKLTQ